MPLPSIRKLLRRRSEIRSHIGHEKEAKEGLEFLEEVKRNPRALDDWIAGIPARSIKNPAEIPEFKRKIINLADRVHKDTALKKAIVYVMKPSFGPDSKATRDMKKAILSIDIYSNHNTYETKTQDDIDLALHEIDEERDNIPGDDDTSRALTTIYNALERIAIAVIDELP